MNTEAESKKLYYFIAGLIAIITALATLAPGTFSTLALALALAYLMNPLIGFLERRRLPRVVSVLSISIVIVGIIVLVLFLVFPYLLEQGIAFARDLPDLVNGAFEKIRHWGIWASLGYEIPATLHQTLDQIASSMKEKGLSVLTPALTAVFNLTSGILGLILSVVSMVLIPVFLFFILKDIDGIKAGFFKFVPPSGKEKVENYLDMVDQVLGGFIRGQIIVASALAVLYAVGLGMTGIRFGVLIGVVSGLLFIIPYVGTVIGIIASAIILIVDFSGWGQVMGVAATFVIAQSIESYILTPRITGDRVGLNQLETLIAILIGGEIGGMTGLLVAIPAGGIVKKTLFMFRPDVKDGTDEGAKGRGGEGARGSMGDGELTEVLEEERKGKGEEETRKE